MGASNSKKGQVVSVSMVRVSSIAAFSNNRNNSFQFIKLNLNLIRLQSYATLVADADSYVQMK